VDMAYGFGCRCALARRWRWRRHRGYFHGVCVYYVYALTQWGHCSAHSSLRSLESPLRYLFLATLMFSAPHAPASTRTPPLHCTRYIPRRRRSEVPAYTVGSARSELRRIRKTEGNPRCAPAYGWIRYTALGADADVYSRTPLEAKVEMKNVRGGTRMRLTPRMWGQWCASSFSLSRVSFSFSFSFRLGAHHVFCKPHAPASTRTPPLPLYSIHPT
jgi:hypothetical protein